MIELGCTAKDKITGFMGVVTGIVHYITGCDQALLVPSVGKDGKVPESQWFDIQRCERLNAPLIRLDNTKTPGPDRAPPKR